MSDNLMSRNAYISTDSLIFNACVKLSFVGEAMLSYPALLF